MVRYKRRFFDFRYVGRERRRPLIMACILFWSILSYYFISRYVCQATEVVGASMAPTLSDGDMAVINRWIYRFTSPRPGEIIAVRVPGYDDLSVKRIIAGPRDTICLQHGKVFVNGGEIEEPYLRPGTMTWSGALTTNVYEIAPECYFVLGDNRPVSADSRYFGAVRTDWVIGRLSAGGRPEDQPGMRVSAGSTSPR